MNKINIFFLFCVITMLGCTTSQPHTAGIRQFVEKRNGRESVWGVDIHLDRLSFKPEVGPDEITIIEGKYGRDLKNIMTWSVSHNHKCLRIRFKPDMGDFGTGNGVTVYIQKTSFAPYRGLNNRYEWSIMTDIQ